MAVKAQAVELHIDELILHGFPAGGRLEIGDAVERELTRLIAERGFEHPHSFEIERVNGGSFKVTRGAGSKIIGAQVARAVHRQFAPEKSRRGK